MMGNTLSRLLVEMPIEWSCQRNCWLVKIGDHIEEVERPHTESRPWVRFFALRQIEERNARES